MYTNSDRMVSIRGSVSAAAAAAAHRTMQDGH